MRAKWNTSFVLVAIMGLMVLTLATLSLSPPRQQAGQVMPTPAADMTGSSETVEARVVCVIETTQREIAPGQFQPVQQLELEILNGPLKGQRVEIEHGAMDMTSQESLYREGDHVLAMVVTQPGGRQLVMITDVVRIWPLALLVMVFIAFTVLVSGWKGARALLGLAISFIVLMGFVLPQILAGRDPVLVGIIGSFVLLAITLYLTQGWALKTHAALLGVLLSLLLTGLLASLTVELIRLSGFGSEEAMFLQAAGASINLRGLLLAGMIVGTLGVLDDVIVGQASAVTELAKANAAMTWRELYQRAMNIGRDHIAATINTLALAYVGAAMPLLLLFQLYPEPWLYTLNRELIAQEIARMLVGSLGLIAAVPITTIIASVLRDWTRRHEA